MRALRWLGASLLATACLDLEEVQPTDAPAGGASGTGTGGKAGWPGSGGASGAGASIGDAAIEADATGDASACGAVKLLDDFNRPDGVLGANWTGQTDQFSVVGSQLKHSIGKNGAVVGVYWASPLCAAQRAYVTLSHIDSATEYTSLALKVQNDSTCDRLTVSYRPQGKLVQIWTCASGKWWLHKEWARQLADGDHLEAEADETGKVTVYVNGTLLGTQSVSGWAFATAGGRIGVTAWQGSGAALFDDFGGG